MANNDDRRSKSGDFWGIKNFCIVKYQHKNNLVTTIIILNNTRQNKNQQMEQLRGENVFFLNKKEGDKLKRRPKIPYGKSYRKKKDWG